jgi:tetratricopeptide (TPR) repeat protein
MRTDLAVLATAVREHVCTDQTPVSPSAFPALWPKPYPRWLGESADPSNDEQALAATATRLFDKGQAHKLGGSLDVSVECFRQSADTFDELAQRFVPRPPYLANAGLCWLALADADKSEDREKKALSALKRLRQAIEINELAPAFRVRPTRAADVANYHHNMGQAIRHLARAEEPESFEPRVLAMSEYERARALNPAHADSLKSLEDPIVGIRQYLADPLPPPSYEFLLDEEPWSR